MPRGEGTSGNILLAGDILHLFAAAAWLGALVALSNMVFGSTDVLVARQALDRFATAGTVIVATIVATGLSSSALLAGRDSPNSRPRVMGSCCC